MSFDDLLDIDELAEEEADELRAASDLDLSVADSLLVDGGDD